MKTKDLCDRILPGGIANAFYPRQDQCFSRGFYQIEKGT